MTGSAKRTRERASREARLLEEIERLDAEAAGIPPEASNAIGEEELTAFRAAVADLVDGLVGALKPLDRDAVAIAIERGATLRLAVDVAPQLRIALYLRAGEDQARYVTLATYGIVPVAAAPAEHVH